MSTPFGKRLLRWTLLIAPWLLALSLALGRGLSVWTPTYLEKLVSRLADEWEVPLSQFHIRDAGLFSADIGPVRLGPEQRGMQIDTIHLTYTPASLKLGRINTVTIEGMTLDCAYDGKQLSLPLLEFLPSSEDTDADRTLPLFPLDTIRVENAVLRCSLPERTVRVPFEVSATPGKKIQFEGGLTPRDQQIRVAGTIGPTSDDLSLRLIATDLRLGAFSDLLPATIRGLVTFEADVTADLSDLDTLAGNVETTIRSLVLPEQGVSLAADSTLSLMATVTGQSVDFSLAPLTTETPIPTTFAIARGHLDGDRLAADFSLDTAGVTLPGTFRADRRENGWQLSLKSANPDRLAVRTGGRIIGLAGLDLSLEGSAAPGTADVVLKASTRGASLGDLPLRTSAVSLTLPLAWPPPETHTPGRLRMARIRHGKRILGTMVTRLRQESMSLALSGALYSQLLPDLKVRLSGNASMEDREATFRFDVPSYALPADFDPSDLVPQAKNIKLSGTLAVEGGINIQHGDIDSRLGVFLTNGSVIAGEEETTRLSGIRLYFESPDLINFRSSPAQLLSFKSLTAGPISIGKGIVTFQLEPGGVVLVERLGFDWVGGRVASRAFRIVPGHDEYDLTLFCSHLRLSSLLEQLGLAEAQGEAALSGELPVVWKQGKISFHDGFLHTAPGLGGVIRVDAMEDLVSTIPQGTPQRGQLELAQAAIRDFEYEWVRIKADTVGEDLLVRLSVDGKPTETLPFVYRKEFGGFARVTGDVKGSNFQGLRLDVNFTLPLDRILLYKDIIDMIER